MILHVENPKNFTHIHTPVRTNIRISCRIINQHIILYSNHEQSEEEITNTIPLTTASKRIKYLGVSLTKAVKNVYTKNYKTLLKEMEEDTN